MELPFDVVSGDLSVRFPYLRAEKAHPRSCRTPITTNPSSTITSPAAAVLIERGGQPLILSNCILLLVTWRRRALRSVRPTLELWNVRDVGTLCLMAFHGLTEQQSAYCRMASPSRPLVSQGDRAMSQLLDADLVLQGGGVKGLALAGAIVELMKTYRFRRVAGTSAGAIVGALVAAGFTREELQVAIDELRYDKVPDRRLPVPIVSETVSLFGFEGMYPGRYIHDWVAAQLAKKDVVTFRDLRLHADDQADPALSGDRGYSFVVTATDVTRGLSLRLPWDYRRLFGRDPDEMSVADAVRMSMSIPFFFEPQRLRSTLSDQTSIIVDGGVLANFPMQLFDRTDGVAPRWPTFGVGTIPDLPGGDSTLVPWLPMPRGSLFGLAEAIVATAVVGNDQTYLDLPEVAKRLMRIDTAGFGVVDFGIDRSRRQQLVDRGTAAAAQFLEGWHGDDRIPSANERT